MKALFQESRDVAFWEAYTAAGGGISRTSWDVAWETCMDLMAHTTINLETTPLEENLGAQSVIRDLQRELVRQNCVIAAGRKKDRDDSWRTSLRISESYVPAKKPVIKDIHLDMTIAVVCRWCGVQFTWVNIVRVGEYYFPDPECTLIQLDNTCGCTEGSKR